LKLPIYPESVSYSPSTKTGQDHSVSVLITACLWLWRERRKYQEDLERMKSAYTALRMNAPLPNSQYMEREKQLLNDLNRAEGKTSTAISLVATELNRVAEALGVPHIENVKEVLVRMGASDIAKHDLPFSREFQQTMTQLVAQKGEAITRLNEAGLRISLGVRYLTLVGGTNPHSVRYVGEHLKQMQEIMQKLAPDVDTPGFKEVFVAGFAARMNTLRKAILNGDEPPSADEVALWTKAFEYAAAHAARPVQQGTGSEPTSNTTEKQEARHSSFSTNGQKKYYTQNGRNGKEG
jgi:hypothetical protein